MRKVQAVIFDMDGILIDTERISFRAFQEVFKNHDYNIDEEFYLTLIGKNSKSIKEAMKKKYGIEFPFDEIYEEKRNLCRAVIAKDGIIIKKGVHELIDYLIKEKYKIAVATSTSRDSALRYLEEIRVKDKVNYVICGDQVINSKPDPEIFLKAAYGLRVEPKSCIVIEDSDAGITAAYKAGMIGINVPDMKQLNDETKKLAFKVCDDLMKVKEYLQEQKI